jgi:UDP-N-acetylmuramate--alanine ligase
MSALAQFQRFRGLEVSGSDRSLDRGQEASKRAYFESIGIQLFPQDGSGVEGAGKLVVSTAIEKSNPEVARALALGIPIEHRAEHLAGIASEYATVAVSGTSGKSTVAAMLFCMLEAAGKNPSLITGANLLSLQAEGFLGNAKVGQGQLLVIEADESDGSLVQYRPHLGLLLNVEKDHQEISELLPLFATFRDRSEIFLAQGEDAHAASLLLSKSERPKDSAWHADRLGNDSLSGLLRGDFASHFTLRGVRFEVPAPGQHNVANAMAALTTATTLGASLEDCARGLSQFQGVERRFVKMGEPRGITVIDDFAHNPAKVEACLRAVKGPGGHHGHPGERRVLAIFHPHGYGPMKLMGEDLLAGAASVLRECDRLFVAEIYDAGGSADRSLSSRDLVDHLNQSLAEGPDNDSSKAGYKPLAIYCEDKAAVLRAVAKEAKPGDWVVSMGARDPGLAGFARELKEALE